MEPCVGVGTILIFSHSLHTVMKRVYTAERRAKPTLTMGRIACIHLLIMLSFPR